MRAVALEGADVPYPGPGVAPVADGSSIVIGSYREGVSFGDAGFVRGSGQFVAKLDQTGAWEWATTIDGGVMFKAVAAAPDGSAIVTGQAFGSDSLGSAGSLTSGPFVAKVDADGSWVWATNAEGDSWSTGMGVTVLADGSAIITGNLLKSVLFGDVGTLTAMGISDPFVAKVDPDGTWVWATGAFGSGHNSAVAVSAFEDGSALVTGYFEEDELVFGDAATLTSVGSGSGSQDIFVAKIGADGEWLWASSTQGEGRDEIHGITALPDGSAILSGIYRNGASFGEAGNLEGAGVFVAEVDRSGRWVRITSTDDHGFSRDVAVLDDGSAVITGHFNRSIGFGEAGTLEALDGSSVFVAKIDRDGSWLWANKVDGPGDNYSGGVAALADGSLILTGTFEDEVSFGHRETTLSGSGMFIAILNSDGTLR